MAGSARSAAAEKHAYLMFAPSSRGARCPGGPGDEFNEFDIWATFGAAAGGGGVDYSVQLGAHARPISAAPRAAGRKKPVDAAAPGSLPMNIPDWKKILGVEYRDHHVSEWELDGDDDDDYVRVGTAAMVPPHELVWRSWAASLSVRQGIGRMLKGRDLSRVRDTIWKKTARTCLPES